VNQSIDEMSNSLEQTGMKKMRALPRKNRGFVLILALVMLAVLTLIGVSSMNSANMELKAASNAAQHQVAFNAVQSLLDYAISDAGVAVLDFQTDSTATQTLTYSLANSSNLTASMNYAGCSSAVGSSLEAGKGFGYNFYNITGTGSNKTGTATSIQGQGVRYPSAAC